MSRTLRTHDYIVVNLKLPVVVFATRQGLWVCQINSCATSRRNWKGCWWSSTSYPTSCTYWKKPWTEEHSASEFLKTHLLPWYRVQDLKLSKPNTLNTLYGVIIINNFYWFNLLREMERLWINEGHWMLN